MLKHNHFKNKIKYFVRFLYQVVKIKQLHAKLLLHFTSQMTTLMYMKAFVPKLQLIIQTNTNETTFTGKITTTVLSTTIRTTTSLEQLPSQEHSQLL